MDDCPYLANDRNRAKYSHSRTRRYQNQKKLVSLWNIVNKLTNGPWTTFLPQVEFHLPEIPRFRHSFHTKSRFYSLKSSGKWKKKKKKGETERKERNKGKGNEKRGWSFAEIRWQRSETTLASSPHRNTRNYIRNIIIIDCATGHPCVKCQYTHWIVDFDLWWLW